MQAISANTIADDQTVLVSPLAHRHLALNSFMSSSSTQCSIHKGCPSAIPARSEPAQGFQGGMEEGQALVI